MIAKHTPGPWTWGSSYNGLYGSGPDNEVLTYQTYEGMWLSDVENQEANALLIAAAPVLLYQAYQALDVLLFCVVAGGGLDDVSARITAIKGLKSAIEAATGESL